jgi:hypothetical protein
MKLGKNQKVMIPTWAPAKAKLMPVHPKSKNTGNGNTTKYLKHTAPIMRHFDYETLQLLGEVMTPKQMKLKFADFIRSYPGYGSKGGKDYAPISASRAFGEMLKEGLIIPV